MKVLYITKPENRGGLPLLLLSIGIVVVLGYATLAENSALKEISSIKDISFFMVIFLGILSCVVFLLDEAVWQMRGKEVCKYDNSGIAIVKYRLIRIEKYVKWESVHSICEYKPYLIKRIATYMTIAGESKNCIVITSMDGRKIRCGENLGPEQTKRIIKIMISMKDNVNENIR